MGVWEGCLHLGDLQGLVRAGAWRARWGCGPITWRVYFVDTLLQKLKILSQDGITGQALLLSDGKHGCVFNLDLWIR